MDSLEAFLGSLGSTRSVLIVPSPSRLEVLCGGFAYHTLYPLGPARPVAGGIYPPASPLHSNVHTVVQEFQPVVHRLRPSASA